MSQTPTNGYDHAAASNGYDHAGPSFGYDRAASSSGYDRAIVEARLGRPARDVLEATVALEAWGGKSALPAMSAARGLINLDSPPLQSRTKVEPTEDREQESVIAEGVTLVLLILSVAAWATPIREQLGPGVLSHAIRVALPVAVALQWALRSRYLSRRAGLQCLARDSLVCSVLMITLVEVPLALIPHWGPVAAMMVPVWVGGTVLTRRGWGLMYAAVLVGGTIALDSGQPAYLALGALTAITLLMCLMAVLTRRQPTDERAGTAHRALLAAMLGGCVGVLLVADPTLGWGVHGIHPAVALLPSVIGSFWGGYYLWNFYDEIPRGLRDVPLGAASRAALADPAMSIFVGAILRLVGATIVLSALVIAAGGWTHGTDALSLFVAFGCVGLVSLLIGMLESFALQRAAVIAAGTALAVELAWPHVIHSHVPGAGLAVGAAVGVLLTLPPLMGRLARSGRVLATMLWIQ
jgi:hypothetical protein